MTKEQIKRQERFTDISDVSHYPFVVQDALRFMCGDKISEGQYRAVFEYGLNNSYVLKVSHTSFANIMEFEVWQAVKRSPAAKWFAECRDISPCGHFLLQRKIKPLPEGFKLPKRLPAFFTDIKKTNFGLLGKRLVCHDYQFLTSAIDCSFAAMKEVEWKE